MDRDSQGTLRESRRRFFSDDRALKLAQKFACRGAIVSVSSLILSSVFGYLAIGKIAKCDANCLSLKARTNCKVAAIALFTVGLCMGLVCLCIHKRISRELRKRKTVVLISTVTEVGLLKSPASKLAHCTAGRTDPDIENVEFQDLPPEYAAAVSLRIGSGVTEAGVALSLDEDLVNPPPSYEEALELMAMQQKRLEQ